MSPASSACVDPETLAAWADRSLPSAQIAEVDRHLAQCERCQSMAAAFARSEPVAPAAQPLWQRWTIRWLVPIAALGTAVIVIWIVQADRRIPGNARTIAPTNAETQIAQAPQAQQSPMETPPVPAAPAPAIAAPPARTDLQRRVAGAGQGRGVAVEPSAKADRAASAVSETTKPAAGQVAAAPVAAATPPPPAAQPAPAPLNAPAAQPVQPTLRQPAPAATAGENRPVTANESIAFDALSRPDRSFDVVAQRNMLQNALADAGTPAGGGAGAGRVGGVGAGRVGGVSGGRGGGGGGGRGGAVAGGAAPAAATPPPDAAPPVPFVRWRVFPSGVVQRSTDGTTWTPLTIDPPAPGLIAGSAPYSNVCWLVGRGGLVLLALDGEHFNRVAFPEAVDLISVQASSARVATIGAADGRTFSTADGGFSWQVR